MANMLQSGSSWLARQLQRSAGRTVSLTQGSTVIGGLIATPSTHEHEVIDDHGFPVRVTSYDWTFLATDLGGLQLRPGAVVQEVLNDTTVSYEAMPLGNRPCVEMLDSAGVMVTLHTKKVN